MPLPDLIVEVNQKEKQTITKTVRAILAMKEEDDTVRPVSFFTRCIQGEFDEIGWVVVPPLIKESRSGTSDRTFTRKASWEEEELGAERDNEQVFREKDGVIQRRVGGSWIKTLGVSAGKNSIPAHVHIFGHKDGIVKESLGYIHVYSSSDEYTVAVMTEFGPVPRTIKVTVSDS